MSDVMLLGVLRMPSELWDGGVVDVAQREARYNQAADLIEELRGKIERYENPDNAGLFLLSEKKGKIVAESHCEIDSDCEQGQLACGCEVAMCQC